MCGIIGAVSHRNVVPVLLDSLGILEYRGYDSSGIAVINSEGVMDRERKVGKVNQLAHSLSNGSTISGTTGIGHTRWATHGEVSEANAHPLACQEKIAVVCNGIIENHEELRAQHLREGCEYNSETDTEVIVHEIHRFQESGLSLLEAVKGTVEKLTGSFAFAVLSITNPEKLIVAKNGSSLLIGLGENETFIASDTLALAKIAKTMISLEDGDIAEISDQSETVIFDRSGSIVQRPDESIPINAKNIELGPYAHYMQKEIFEQAAAVSSTLKDRVTSDSVVENEVLTGKATEILDRVEAVRILACGTSFYAGLIAKFWFEALGIPCETEIASEFRYRKPVIANNTLLIAISQSGETADTLAALEYASELGCRYTLAICNSPASKITRMVDLVLHTHAGPEISVASTKAFSTQLVSLLLLMILLARRKGLTAQEESEVVHEIRALPSRIDAALQMDRKIHSLAKQFVDKEHTLMLGRGTHYPIALEGALKLKEISYIHADAYPAGELKHGPLALIDANVPTVAVAPNNHLLTKLKNNIQEVKTRGGKLFVFSDAGDSIKSDELIEVIDVIQSGPYTSPIIHVIPLQLLAYHVAVMRGEDVDNPRNLAKSVTVE